MTVTVVAAAATTTEPAAAAAQTAGDAELEQLVADAYSAAEAVPVIVSPPPLVKLITFVLVPLMIEYQFNCPVGAAPCTGCTHVPNATDCEPGAVVPHPCP